jgi:hypothetical protein
MVMVGYLGFLVDYVSVRQGLRSPLPLPVTVRALPLRCYPWY